MVIQLIREAGKSIAAMPIILFEPVLTFIAASIGAVIFVYFLMLATDAGTLGKDHSSHIPSDVTTYEYLDNGAVGVSVLMMMVCAIWMFYFIIDCQHMIIAGAVARWFFTR